MADDDFSYSLSFSHLTQKWTASSTEYEWVFYSNIAGTHFQCTHIPTGKKTGSDYDIFPNIVRYELKLSRSGYLRLDVEGYDITIIGGWVENQPHQGEDIQDSNTEINPTASSGVDELPKEDLDQPFISTVTEKEEEFQCIPTGVDELPKEDLDQPFISTVTEKEEEFQCMVCLDTVVIGEKYRFFPCGHKYHAPCIGVWLKKKTFCPNCRQQVDIV